MYRFFYKTSNSPAQLIIRLALAAVIFPHGAQKVFGWFGGPGFTKTLQTFSSMGFPPWSTVLLMITETLGSLFLAFGVLTRLWALAIGTSITICMSMYHVQYGFFMNWFGNQKGEGIEYHILAIGIALALVISGGGMLSADRYLGKKY
jgi:putative oxidoreductase